MSITFPPSKPIKRRQHRIIFRIGDILRVFNYTVHNFYSLQMMILYIVNDIEYQSHTTRYVRQLMNTTTQVCEYIFN